MTNAEQSLRHGNEFPYDASDAWWRSHSRKPPRAKDWAHRAARGILADLTDRRAVKWGFDDVDGATRKEIAASLAAIIREAAEE